MNLVTLTGSGLAQEVGAPAYGRQDLGYSPGGPQDRFAMRTGNILLGNDDFAPALEIVQPPLIEFAADCLFVLTGAKRREAVLRAPRTAVGISHGAVARARPGDRLTLGEPEYGLRTYVCLAPCAGRPPAVLKAMLGRTRPAYRELSSWADPHGRIRVVAGPEFRRLKAPSAFLDQPWMAAEMSDMGIRLEAAGDARPEVDRADMISQPVNDGTIQLTPKGPIVLLRRRATIGGYPRIFNVIGVDVDLLAQHGPGQVVRFRRVSLAAARAAARRQQKDLERLRRRV
jgi:5-oxoprolinase (ATP-hydrolysing) subunit C